jgi:hypothetical protein
MINLEKEKGIISLAVVLSVGFFALSMALVNSLGALTELTKNRNTGFGENAFYNAEAAAREGAYQYIKNYINGNNEPYNPENYDKIINNNSSAKIDIIENWPLAEIVGMAHNQYTLRKVAYIVNVFPEGLAFDHAVFSKNNLNFSGDSFVEGNIFAENKISFNGVNAEIDGDAFSTGEIEPTSNIKGSINSFSGSIPYPQIDLDSYIEAASNSGTFFDSSKDAEKYLKGEQSGVIFIDQTTKKTSLQDQTSLTGSLVVKNNLDLTGGKYVASDNYLAIIVFGDLKVAGGAEIHGVVYVFGSTSFGAGGAKIYGSLISIGEINDTELTGTAKIFYDQELTNNWQEIQGLNTVSSVDPIITNWKEF